jgi:hypothetical protein
LPKHREQNVTKYFIWIGTHIQKGWTEA